MLSLLNIDPVSDLTWIWTVSTFIVECGLICLGSLKCILTNSNFVLYYLWSSMKTSWDLNYIVKSDEYIIDGSDFSLNLIYDLSNIASNGYVNIISLDDCALGMITVVLINSVSILSRLNPLIVNILSLVHSHTCLAYVNVSWGHDEQPDVEYISRSNAFVLLFEL